jgi:hypothetical protein
MPNLGSVNHEMRSHKWRQVGTLAAEAQHAQHACFTIAFRPMQCYFTPA